MDDNLLDRLEEKAVYHAREAERYRVAADVLRSELKGSGRNARSARAEGRTADRADDPRANTKAMVERALNDSPRPMQAAELVEEMLRLGWETTAQNKLNTARTAASRLVEDGRIERIAGRYARLGLPEHAESDASDDGPSARTAEPTADDPWATPPSSGKWEATDEPPF